MQSISPVFGPDELQYEKVIALDQPEYSPIIIKPQHGMSVHFRFSEAEREQMWLGIEQKDAIIRAYAPPKPKRKAPPFANHQARYKKLARQVAAK